MNDIAVVVRMIAHVSALITGLLFSHHLFVFEAFSFMLSVPFPSPPPIHVQYCDVLHNRHHKVSQSLPFFMHCKTVTILARGIHAQKPKQASVHSLKSQRNPKGMHSIFESVFCPISLRIRVRGHFVMSITKNHESHMSQY